MLWFVGLSRLHHHMTEVDLILREDEHDDDYIPSADDDMGFDEPYFKEIDELVEDPEEELALEEDVVQVPETEEVVSAMESGEIGQFSETEAPPPILELAIDEEIASLFGATGIEATGIEATGIEATGIEATGIEATSIEATSIKATSIEATSIEATSIEATSIAEEPKSSPPQSRSYGEAETAATLDRAQDEQEDEANVEKSAAPSKEHSAVLEVPKLSEDESGDGEDYEDDFFFDDSDSDETE
eukprot:scaffold904_cov239-Pinguiococcus_pyrenoidosus.AAC.11